MFERLLSIGKVSQILGVSIDTLRQWEKTGKLNPVKTPGSHRRYKTSDIEAFLSNSFTVKEECIMKKILKFYLVSQLKIMPEIYEILDKLNSSNWMSYEPETCKVTSIKQRKGGIIGEFAEFDIEVEHRPRGYITYDKGGFWWDSWKIYHLDTMRDGTLLDGKGNPLPEGEDPVVIDFAPYKNLDFNKYQFGKLIDDKEFVGTDTVT